ncbi:hypothetical protein BGZ96_011857 [Linnemannia gamsii]|uniref:Uncharacterized protein n=1 Tax=Linnemannia gamsii TaxID=64522 RepID=A0ABQ7KBR0_9FUNG|nr:hypothetical protein BGZ96_011857 [Linnemannia gamsii]
MTPQEWTPTSLLGSYPPSPTAPCALGPSSSAISDYPYFTAATASATMTPATAAQPKTASVPLPPVPPSPPLPPLPPKSPKTLIAQYFPRSLAPPPSRDRTPYGQRDTVVAPTPFKTPTFGPALVSPTSTTHSDAPPLPSPSASFQYIPTVDISRISTSHALHNNQHHQHLFTEDNSSDFSSSSNRPSPNASLIGFQGSAAPTPPRMMPHQQHPARLPSDLDLILNNSRQRPARLACSTSTLSKQGASSVSSNEGSAAGPMNTTTSAQDEGVAPLPAVATPILLFAPLRPRSPAAGSGIRATPSTTSLSNPHIPPSPTGLPTTPIYPRGLSTPSILGDNAQVIIRLHQKPVPYIRELIPGKETGPAVIASTDGDAAGKRVRPLSTVAFVTTPPSQPASTNTSRDLEMILDEITGRLRTNRTSMDPWAYNLSPWDDKPLPAVRRERGSRFWVFRDQDGLVSGPILFLLGHLFPPLWWVGALYPRLEHPDDIAALESQLARAAEMEAYSAAIGAAAQAQSQTQTHVQEKEGEDDARDHQNGVALQWLQRQLRTLGVTVASITLSSSSSPSKPQPGSSDDENTTIATFQMVQVGESSADDNEREGSTLANISAIHVPYQPPVPTPMPPSILDSRGPWAARGDTSSRASSLFEQRMAHDRKVLRYELDLRWRRINLLWSFVSLLLAICLVAIVLGARK